MNINLKAKLNIMAGVAIAAVLILTGMSLLIEVKTSVGSNTYYNIKAGNNFVADIAPPPLFMVEASRQANKLLSIDASQRKALSKAIEKHLDEFEASIDRWEKDQYLSAELKSIVTNKLKPQGKEYIDIIRDDVLEAVDNAAMVEGLKKGAELFEEHEEIVIDLTKKAVVASEKVENDAVSSIDKINILLWIIVAISIISVFFFSILYSKSIINSLGADPEKLKQIAQSIARGDADIKIDNAHQGSVLHAVSEMYDSLNDMRSQSAAVDRVQAIIEFSMDGMILNANQNFLNVMGYRLDEIKGKHHSMFVEASFRSSPDYRLFWEKLGRGEFAADQYKRIGKDGKEVWIQASYTPVLNAEGRPVKVVKYATDITEHALKKLAAERDMNRILGALGSTSSNVMVADPNRVIIYMNKAVEKMLREVEADMKRVLPHFAVDRILGTNMDSFHKNPAHQMNLLANLKDTYVSNILVAGISFRLIANPIFSQAGERLGTVVEWINRTHEVKAEHEMSRILGALETTTTNVMIADADRKIIYMNKSVDTMLRRAENDIRTVLPHFSVDKILGGSMDSFHKNPAHQSKLLENLTTTYTSNIVVGKRHFRLVANPIFAKDGSRLGSVVEWLDRTEEVGVESEVSKLVEAAASGNFSMRLVTDGKTGFFLKLAEGLNMLVNTADKGLNDVARVLGSIAKGDLTERIDGDYAGTFGDLKNYCNETTTSLTNMLGDIRIAADTIFTASSEIAQGNADLSSRTEQQAANLEETASSMEELTSTVKLNADNAKQANVLAEQASTVATDGGSLIQQVVSTMNAINESARKISDIIGVIDGIAFQTNILALNAAVEAARAGDQGRGFAVVASEVRTLAQRSANAAKDIKALISDSVQKIENGNELVGKSGNTMKEIVNAIKRVNDIMAEIAAASAEQSTGIEEVSTAVSQMDEMTQQNAALVEEAAAAAESLQSQADQLNRNVAQFKLSNEQRMLSAPVSRPSIPAPAKKAKPAAAPKKLTPPPSAADDEWEQF